MTSLVRSRMSTDTVPISGRQTTLRCGPYTAEIASVGSSLRSLRHNGRDLIIPFRNIRSAQPTEVQYWHLNPTGLSAAGMNSKALNTSLVSTNRAGATHSMGFWPGKTGAPWNPTSPQLSCPPSSKRGAVLFPRLPELKVSTEEFVKLLRLQAHVTVTPGAEFSPQHGHSIRLNYSQDHNQAVAAVERLIELAKRYTR